MSLNALAAHIYEGNKAKGFWDGGWEAKNFAEALMLVTSELSEALEAYRTGLNVNDPNIVGDYVIAKIAGKGDKDNYIQNVKGSVGEEIADAIIRLLDISAGYELDIDFHVEAKLAYNATREHKHGKKF